MASVTVDLDDLEKLVMATGAIMAIEAAINARQHDPFVRAVLPLTEANNRLATAMRNAKRASADTLVKWNEPLTEDELRALREIDGGKFSITPTEKVSDPDFDRLSAKGMIRLGQKLHGILWAGDKLPRWQVDPSCYAVEITDRGYAALNTSIQNWREDPAQ